MLTETSAFIQELLIPDSTLIIERGVYRTGAGQCISCNHAATIPEEEEGDRITLLILSVAFIIRAGMVTISPDGILTVMLP